jgi:iron complex outermembrane receptor protein
MTKTRFYTPAIASSFSLSAITLALCVSNMAFAQQPALETSQEQNSSPIDDVIIVTGSHTPIAKLTASSNVDVISQAEIERVLAVTPADILNRVTGVHVHTNNGMESLPAMRSPVLTGPGAAGAFIFAQDGIATRAAGFANNNGLSELNLAAASAVEVIRGPASAIYGSNAVHGVVNALSANVDQPGRLRFLYGDNNHINIATKFSGEEYAIDYQHVNDGGFRDESDFVSNKLDGKFITQFSGATVTTTFSGFNLDQETAGFISSGSNGECYTSTLADDVLFEDTAAMSKNCDPDAYRQWSSVRWASNWEWSLANGAKLDLTPFYRNNHMEFRQHYLPSRAIEENSHSSVGLKTIYSQSLSNDFDVVVGLDLESTNGSLIETQDAPDRYSWGKARQQGQHFNYAVDAQIIAPFAQVIYQASEQLSLDASVRFDNTQYDYDNLIADGTTKADGTSCTNNNDAPIACLFLRPADRSDDFSNTSISLGANYLVTDSSALFASIASGFRAPQTTDLYRLQNQQSIGTIDSESTDSIEIGYRQQAQDLSYEVVWYTMKKDNFFFRDADGLNVTDGKTTHTGLELGVDYQLTSTLNVGVNYSFASHEYDFERTSSGVVAGNEIDTAPSKMGNIQVTWQPTDALSMELEWLHMGQYFLEPANEHEYDGHDLVHLRTNYRMNETVTFSANIDNLTDEAYASRADYAFGTYRFFAGQPRNVKVGVTVNF